MTLVGPELLSVPASDGGSDGVEAFQGTWELLAAPAPVVVSPPRSRPWGTAYCFNADLSAIPAASAGRRSRKYLKSVPCERTGFFTDKSGLAVNTPSRPTPRPRPPAVDNEATRAWQAFFGRPGTTKDANSHLKDSKRNRDSWGECELLQAANPREAPSGTGGDPRVPPLPLRGRGPSKVYEDSNVSKNTSSGSEAADVPRRPAVSAKVKARKASNSRWASHLSLLGCWIADTACGYDRLSMRWVDEVDRDRLTKIGNPPTFAGVGCVMAGNMKLLMKSSALKSAIEPYVLPSTPDVISIGKRCVELCWSFWCPPWSKRPVLTS